MARHSSAYQRGSAFPPSGRRSPSPQPEPARDATDSPTHPEAGSGAYPGVTDPLSYPGAGDPATFPDAASPRAYPTAADPAAYPAAAGSPHPGAARSPAYPGISEPSMDHPNAAGGPAYPSVAAPNQPGRFGAADAVGPAGVAPGAPAVIRAAGISKRFVSGRNRATSLKERFVRRGGPAGDDFWALRDIDATIGRGQTVGLAGANGSGKSTLLKVLAGILRPTSGDVEVHGRIASLLELGAGFNGELSGRDNVYLNASLLGLSKREIDRLFDSIVDFAELRHKIDDDVKHYSSGQYVRLGFAVAVHVDPDVLLVDEVLAVGDEAFQRKCLAKIAEFRAQGRTILFVTHSLDLIESMCDRVLVLESGSLIFDGQPAVGTKLLRQKLGSLPAEGPVDWQYATVRPQSVSFSPEPGGLSMVQYDPGQRLTVSVELDVTEGAPENIYLHTYIVGQSEVPIWMMETPAGGFVLGPGRHTVDFSVPHLPELLGAFAIKVHVSDAATGAPVTTRRFDELFGVTGPQADGLLKVDYEARLRA
ncbi:ABC transporter ATP-binding protein (Partial match) [Frankia canadensis]|uniref:ABC transporter ATP-binding protein (Partial match) n=2 Tax=Frankia canadensis TaxID=1836972 RepID=A0A2I2KMV4_9ACTN|nr:ABC transporter ATP-binding protein (Partial match) [Frankia canadensis]SOU54283.1 ABC transporter ATP-binding protein (Partial match) [Frankia canadensis]